MSRNADPMARGFPKAPEPFGSTANPGGYTPRPATEEALEALVRSSGGPTAVTALCGPPGLGKTLLLHLLSARVGEGTHVVFVPYGAFNPEDFCAFVLNQLGSPPADHAVSLLRAYAQHLRQDGASLMLLIDDAGAMPPETLTWCSDFARGAAGAVHCVFAITDDVYSAQTIAALGDDIERIRLTAPMTLEETTDYVEVQLALGRAPGAVRELFDEGTIQRLFQVSGGVPRELHTAAQAVLRQEPQPAPAPEPAPEPTPSQKETPAETPEAASPMAPTPPEPSVRDTAAAPVAPAIRAEIEQLRRAVAARHAAQQDADTQASPRARLMIGAFALAVVVGLATAAYRPLSTWIQRAPEPPPTVTFTDETAALLVARDDPKLPAVPQPRAPAGLEAPAEAPSPASPAIASVEPPPPEPLQELVPEGPQAAPPLAVAPIPEAGAEEAGSAAEVVAQEATEAADAPEPVVDEGAVAVVVPVPELPAEAAAPVAAEVAVNINATPWATIEVDGEALGETPLAGVSLTAGVHTFRATLPGGRVVEREVEIDAENRFVVFDDAPTAAPTSP